ncbi:hypothetical protein N8128_06955 [Paracoccaceae bacterium]|nr:hypothetical protein [Paracoccaceae bacterium]
MTDTLGPIITSVSYSDNIVRLGEDGFDLKNLPVTWGVSDDDSVVTWGGADFGGDSSLVTDNLSSGVTKIFISSSSSAFATLKIDTRKNAVSVKELFRNILFKFRQNNSFRCFTTKAHNG